MMPSVVRHPVALLAALAAAVLLAAGPGGAAAQDTEAAYVKGKTVKLSVRCGGGGGYDVYARMLAPHISKALETTVIVENQPGAGGLSALARMAVAPPDGLAMMIVNGAGASMAQLAEQSGV